MKYVLTVLFLTALVVVQDTPAPPASAPPQAIPTDQENSRKARAILDQGIQALGGNAYLNIQNMTQEGRAYSFHHGEPNSLGTLFWRFKKFPDKDRLELTKKRDVIELYTGDKGSHTAACAIWTRRTSPHICEGGILGWTWSCGSG
jgi:hypothetical protein